MQTKTLITYTNRTTWVASAAAIVFFAVLTAVAARLTLHIGPVPFTLQTLVVVLAGLALGSRGGAASQILYLSLLVTGLPLDASGLGPAAFFGPTAGYLIGFVPAAFVTGWLAEGFAVQRWWGHFLAATAGSIVIYLVGFPWLAIYLGSLSAAWLAGVLPFIIPDLLKIGIATTLAEGGKYLLNR